MKQTAEGIAIYSRKSRFTGKGDSIGNQIELCREYIRMQYGEEALASVLIYEDEGFSGGNLNRPAFQRMMKEAENRRFRAIIVYRLDRISRNISDFAGLIETLSRLETAFISVKEQFDTGTPMGRAMMYIASVFSQLERETIAERIRDNMRELAKTGRWLGGTTPTGYASEAVTSASIDGKPKKVCRLKPVPEEAAIVKTIFDLYLEYDSLTMTEAELMRRGVKTKNGKYFTRHTSKAILKNPVYMIADEEAYQYFITAQSELCSGKEEFDGVHGLMVYNRTRQQKGAAAEELPPDEWIAAVGRHPGIISGKAWTQVQESLERNKNKAYRKPRSNEALLTGLLYCSCGSRMYPKMGRRTKDGKIPYSYVCKKKERSRGAVCEGPNISGNRLDEEILKQLGEYPEDRGRFEKLLENSLRSCCAQNPREEQKTALSRQKEELEQKIGGLADSFSDLKTEAARRQVEQRIEALSRKEQQIDGWMRELEQRMAQTEYSGTELLLLGQQLELFRESFREGFRYMTPGQKRNFVRSMIQRAVWNGETVQVYLAEREDGRETHWREDSK